MHTKLYHVIFEATIEDCYFRITDSLGFPDIWITREVFICYMYVVLYYAVCLEASKGEGVLWSVVPSNVCQILYLDLGGPPSLLPFTLNT